MLDDYQSRREVIIEKRSEEFAKRKHLSQKKIEAEKAKRRAAILQEREQERSRVLEEERLRREQEEEEARLEAGMFPLCSHGCRTHQVSRPSVERFAEKERRAAEEEAALAAVEANKREEEEVCAGARRKREEECAASLDKIRLQQQCEEEALANAAARAAERTKAPSSPNGTYDHKLGFWRCLEADAPVSSIAVTPRAESPTPKFRPGAVSGGG